MLRVSKRCRSSSASAGQLLHEFGIADGTQVRAIAWSPDGTRLAIAADFNVVEIWDVASGERVQSLLLTRAFERWLWLRPHHNPRDIASAVAWSPDGRFLAAGSSDASAGVWELASGEQVLSLNGQTEQIGDIEFSPDGRRIATASQDRTVWVWDSSSIYE
jgi:WD40 repeat protein